MTGMTTFSVKVVSHFLDVSFVDTICPDGPIRTIRVQTLQHKNVRFSHLVYPHLSCRLFSRDLEINNVAATRKIR